MCMFVFMYVCLFVCLSGYRDICRFFYISFNSLASRSAWEAYSFSAPQDIQRILWNPKVQCGFGNPPLLVQPSWNRSIQSTRKPPPLHRRVSLRSILILSFHLRRFFCKANENISLQEQRELAGIKDVCSKFAQTVMNHWCKQRMSWNVS